MRKYFLLICLSFTVLCVRAQSYTISGFVLDALTGETLINASVINAQSIAGVVSNDYGFYSFTSKGANLNLQVSYVGYQNYSIVLNSLKNDTTINVALSPDLALEEVIVEGTRNQKVMSSQVSMAKIDVKKASLLPVLIGETDLVKTIQLLPGVQIGTEGTGGLQVRGGGQGDNLVLLDGAPVYNVNHLFGFFSVFNSDAIQNVDLYKGGFPARYGGRLSSVLDVRMKEGNSQEFEGSGSIGLISSKFTLQGPIIKDKTSFIVSARRTYLDLLLKPFTKDLSYYFYDANAKINHMFSAKSRLFLSFYTGKDDLFLGLNDDFIGGEDSERKDQIDTKLGWGNITSSMRWNYVFNSKLFLNSTVLYSKYQTNINSDVKTNLFAYQENIQANSKSNLENNSLLLDFSYFPNNQNSVKFGGSYTYFTYLPLATHGVKSLTFFEDDGTENTEELTDTTIWNDKVYSHEMHVYLEDDIDLTPRLKANVGLHGSFYKVEDTWYNALEPRIALRYMLTPNWSIKAAYSNMAQYVFQYPNMIELYKKGDVLYLSANPEAWLPATSRLTPQKSKQWVLGSFYSWDKGFDFSVEAYYKSMDNVITERAMEYSQEPILHWEELFEQGKGRSYGLEFYAEKKTGKTTGWVSYTLSKTDRQFDNINHGEAYPYIYDRRHALNIVLNHKFSPRFDMGLVWVYGSGRNVTLADGQYSSNLNSNTDGVNNDIQVQSTINAYKMPAYNRLDVGLNFHKEKKWGKRTWSMGLYNAYNYHNSFLIYMDYNEMNEGQQVLKSLSILPVIPYLSYSFKF